MSTEHEATTRSFFLAMQTGAAAENDMMTLFAEDAVYVEPFSGRPRTHTGKSAIRGVMREGWRKQLPDVRIDVERVQIDGDDVIADWTCHSPAIPGGRGQGTNVYTLRDGLIVRLVTTLRH